MLIQVAGREHEGQLRELMRGAAMPGWIRIAFGREPDFFQAVDVQGHLNEVLIALKEGRVLGMGCRSLRRGYINGERMEMGYLGGLRLDPEIRRTGTLARGYAALKRLHQARPAPVYLTTVIEDNLEARKVLTSGRAGLPHYLDRGRYITHAINLNRRRRGYVSPVAIRRGDEVGLEAVLKFMEETGGQRQFFPALEAGDFGGERLRGLRLEDFRVALLGDGEIAGVAAVWDQGAYKQHLVQGYAGPARVLRPLINGGLRLAGFRPLPPPGETLNALHVAFACVRGDDAGIMRALLERIHAEHQHGEHHFLLWGVHERDPLRAAASHFVAFRYVSRFYLVCWDDGLEFVAGLDPGRIPYLELATL